MKAKEIVFIALSAAIICVISPFSISIGTIPYTLSIFIIALIGMLFKPLYSLIIVLIYIVLGILGLPVFGNFTGGIGILLGVTGGFIIGYIPFIVIISFFSQKFDSIYMQIIGAIIALLVCYLFGTFWFMWETQSTFLETIVITIVPFIIIDCVKIALALVIGRILKKRIHFI